MSDILMGAAGFVLALGLFSGGAAAGWMLCRRAGSQSGRADPPDAETMRRLAEEQSAFLRMQNYSTQDAYGLNGDGGYTTGTTTERGGG